MHQHLVHEYEEKVSLKARILSMYEQLLEAQPSSPSIGSSVDRRGVGRGSIPGSPSQYVVRYDLHQYFLRLFDHVIANRPSESELATSLAEFESQAPISNPDTLDDSTSVSFSDFSSTSVEFSESSEASFRIESDTEDQPAQTKRQEKGKIGPQDRNQPLERSRHRDPMSEGV